VTIAVPILDEGPVEQRGSVRATDLKHRWRETVEALPPSHSLMITGPFGEDRHYNVGVIYSGRQVFSEKGDILSAFMAVRNRLRVYSPMPRPKRVQPPTKKAAKEAVVAPVVATPPNPRPPLPERDAKGHFLPKKKTPPAEAVGFTRDRDLVAYLFYKRGWVTKHELRHTYRIQNPPQAINEAEAHYHFTAVTGDALPNGDVPYVLSGSIPALEGMIPMFAEGVEDSDDPLYVRELDLYMCTSCGRHPVYRPTKGEGKYYAGICPRHGAVHFKKV